MKKKVLFIDRDGTLIREVPPTYQTDSFEKLIFYPEVFQYLGAIARDLDFELVMVTNQDGLGTDSFPEDTFWPVQNFILDTLKGEGIHFNAVHIDRSFADQQAPTRKPGIGMLLSYLNSDQYDIAGSFVIGDRLTDVELAYNLGCRALWLNNDPALGIAQSSLSEDQIKATVACSSADWRDFYKFLKLGERKTVHERNTHETRIQVVLNLDGNGAYDIQTGLGFFDHMLEQLARHGKMDMIIRCDGDLNVDEHHSIEDTAITLGEAFAELLSDKRGLNRYGFALPMDDADAKVLIDFGGRSWLVWNAEFKREKIGDMPTEMFYHFFKSFCDAARCNLNIECHGNNEHHKIEAIFKAMAKAIRMAVVKDPFSNYLPSTKGIL